MTVITTLADSEDCADVAVLHQGIPDAIPATGNEIGTSMALANLARLVEAKDVSDD